MYCLFVTGLEFYAYHGVSAEERAVGHRYRMDLELAVAGSADQTDRVADTVDYAKAAEAALEAAQSTQCHTIERVAHLVGTRLLAEHSAIEIATVRLCNRLPPAPIVAEEAAVELRLSRNA